MQVLPVINAREAEIVLTSLLTEIEKATSEQQKIQSAFLLVQEDLTDANARLATLTTLKNALLQLPEIQDVAKASRILIS